MTQEMGNKIAELSYEDLEAVTGGNGVVNIDNSDVSHDKFKVKGNGTLNANKDDIKDSQFYIE
ncbi:MAG: hypothetical protein JOZ78_27410 [Chroococcidiopsidaceae cyanobacterium CP_BM_ER_R8_30]|nr:hypothetical protein [Chroococcidiopsidaceae cyanobacterium CP_BM_ER_R8_30]